VLVYDELFSCIIFVCYNGYHIVSNPAESVSQTPPKLLGSIYIIREIRRLHLSLWPINPLI
jgi:hypothetical protein